MAENSAMRLLAIFLFCSLFSFNTSIKGMDDTTDTNEPLSVSDVTAEEPAEEVTAEAPAKEEVSAPEKTSKSKVQSSRVTKKVSKAKRSSKKRSDVAKTGKSRKAAMPTTAKAGAKSHAKKVGTSEITKMAKFDKSGDIESFTAATTKVANFIQNAKTLRTSKERMDLYAAIVGIYYTIGGVNFSDEEHYDAGLKVLNAALDNPKLFGSFQLKRITEFQKNLQAKKDNPELRKTESTSAARRKQPSRTRSKTTTTRKAATRPTRSVR